MMRSLQSRTTSANSPFAGELRVVVGEPFFARRVDQEPEHQVGELVTSSAVDRPVFAQAFVVRQDLLDDQISVLSAMTCSEPPQIFLGFSRPST